MHYPGLSGLPPLITDAQLNIPGQLSVQAEVPQEVLAALQAVEHGETDRRIGVALEFHLYVGNF